MNMSPLPPCEHAERALLARCPSRPQDWNTKLNENERFFISYVRAQRKSPFPISHAEGCHGVGECVSRRHGDAAEL